MLIVGELINSSRKPIAQAIAARDKAYLQDLAVKQVEAGANIIDVNCGTSLGEEASIMAWLVDIIQEVVDVPLCIDTPSPEALEAGLSRHKGKAMINSITAEKERWEKVLPLVTKYKASVIGLCMDDTGMPETVEDRLRVAERIVSGLISAGVPLEDIYLDPLIKPLGVNSSYGKEALESTRALKEKFPKVHLICGLSNVSYGLPERRLLNRAFAIMCLTMGMDAFILDPLDRSLMSLLTAAKALAGLDEYCLEYITAARSGKLVV
ncbi:5-methyltetrahydrofolate--homocysteine methyltransferase [Thermanaeromonas toyohensis ToBE]|uniref:5-methyltetrahydrofolate--homocysteine methyltransferase n=1 Tax=Thermanaeromonas toyohensis ToBE TaxID=698762 RepID=A0A1W1W2S7_9FIRM|nr:methyltetrahydrofolate cobalamin methyltransferase [Thermanaeromonas toyohensis]SMB99915.1 5-methyltetrahydrofolate--homocysteine methyltransferase [Thermanaeromonas toyohensis ToBE]